MLWFIRLYVSIKQNSGLYINVKYRT